MLGHSALAEAPLASLLDAAVTVVETLTLRFATQSFVTRSTDAPAHTYIPGRITKGLTLGRGLTSAEGGQFGSLLQATFGEIELANSDGELDSMIDQYFADGRPLRLKIGATEVNSVGRENVKAYNEFVTVYTSISGGWTFERDVVRLRISGYHTSQRPDRPNERSASKLQDRIQALTYAGTGGEFGGAEMTGRTLPMAFGTCFNIPAQLVDPLVLTYQFHSGRMDAFLAVYDAGIALTFDADFPSYTELVNAEISAGSFGSCTEAGFIKLGAAPFGAVTANVRGHRSSFAAGNEYEETHGSVLRRILLDFSPLTETELDNDSFDALDVAQPHSMGFFLPAGDTSTIEQVIEQIAFSCGAFAGQDRSGLYRVQRLEVPRDIAHWVFNDREIIGIERERLPYEVPWSTWAVGYERNWTVQSGSDLAAAVGQDRRQFLESEYRFVYTQNADIAIAHGTSSGAPPRRSFFIDQTAATEEAERLSGFYGASRAMYRVSVKTALFSIEIGQTVRLLYHRWGLSGGKNFVVLSVNDDADFGITEMVVFG